MSSVAELQEEVVTNYIITSSIVLFFYESIITFCEEVDVIWRRKWTTMTWIYALTRYSTVAVNIVDFWPHGNIKSCEAELIIYDVLVLTPFLCFALFSALRVYALSDGRYIMAGLVLLLNLVPFAVNLFTFSTEKLVYDPEDCLAIFSGSASLSLTVSLVARISAIIGDAIVLVVTWMKTAKLYNDARRTGVKAPLAVMLIQDGTLYFVILLVINVLQVFGTNVQILVVIDISKPFFQIFTPIIVGRFILNLRQVESVGSSWVSCNQSQSLRFVGNMGQSLRFGGEDDDDEMDTDQHTAGSNALPELVTEASDPGEANEGHAGSHLDFAIQEVPVHFDPEV